MTKWIQLFNQFNINKMVDEIYSTSKVVFPQKENVFKAFYLTKFENIKVVILGQDPYYTEGVADGLAFSSQQSKTPPSLANIFKEIKLEYPNSEFKSNDLSYWAKQGVLLLNTSLTVEINKPNSHQIYWKNFIESVISQISLNKEKIVFVLWGNKAKTYRKFININKHYILESGHPSPLSCNTFFGNGHFSKINYLLNLNGFNVIDWSIK